MRLGRLMAALILAASGIGATQAPEPAGQAPVADSPTPLHVEHRVVVATSEMVVPPKPAKPRPARRRSAPAQRHGAEHWRPLVEASGLPVEWALRVISCESRGNAQAVSPNGRYRGLMQTTNGPLDPAANLAHAKSILERQGKAAWPTCG